MLTKQEIINQLQEYTKENGGKTPGQKQFLENTGISIFDRMKHWPNYGELVIEAGLTPNKFDKTKYNHQQLCEFFIETIRENKKWPTRGILDVKHHNDSSFPEASTFYKKLGLTKDLAKKILKFIEDKKGHQDILTICAPVLEKYSNQQGIVEENTEKKKHGYVYLFRHGNRNQYRVGRTYDLLRRGSEIRIQLPERTTLIHTIETVDPIGIETYWLNRFKEKKINGDWFSLSPNDLSEFKHWKRIV
jgi:hypothetical protein